jgi:predicted nucleic acid-binding protein
METFIADAHSLAWFITQNPKISTRAVEIFREAENADVEVLIPTIVLAELLYLSERKKISTSIAEMLRRVHESSGFVVVPFDWQIFEAMQHLPTELEIHDRIIAATAKIYGGKVITKDEQLRNTNAVEVIW